MSVRSRWVIVKLQFSRRFVSSSTVQAPLLLGEWEIHYLHKSEGGAGLQLQWGRKQAISCFLKSYSTTNYQHKDSFFYSVSVIFCILWFSATHHLSLHLSSSFSYWFLSQLPLHVSCFQLYVFSTSSYWK